MRPTYGIRDLFALVEKLLAPFVDPLRAEFAVQAIDRPRPSTPPQPQPQPAPVREPATPIVTRPAVADTLPAVNVVVSFSPVAADFTASTSAEPLFVRVGSGRGARYRLDDGHTPGERFRKLVRNGRPKYEPAR